ncbi:MAG TPA: hypothetical protein VK835_10460 [Bacteroidia bacterium]|jgi:hypothetical protein|nr:hypothetical protein [Bacteroidia bacterium]
MIKRLLYSVLLLFILADTGYSFLQYLNQPLDGDIAWNTVPAEENKKVLNNPFGTDVILKHKTYPNPNRFFCHWMINRYFNVTPLVLQKFVQPIDSVYLSCAIAKTLIQLFLILLLAAAISGTSKLFKLDFIIAAALVTPLFQANGYRSYMGIIDPSPTYTFFYALPCVLLLLYFSPFIFQYYHGKKPATELLIKIGWIPLAIVVCLSGALNPGVVLIFSFLAFLSNFKKNFSKSTENGFIKKVRNSIIQIPKNYWFYLLPSCLFSFYSLYLGRYNSNNINISLTELYSRLPEGIYYQFTQKLGFPILFIILTINAIIINRNFKTAEGKKILHLYKWVGLFALIYILLLPLGGYRDYRPNTVRYDTIMPITFSLMFLFGITTLFIFKSSSKNNKTWYIPLIIMVLFIFTNADKPQFDENKRERNALKEIVESKTKIVEVPDNCKVLSWGKMLKPEDSELNSQLLFIWRITDEKKLYYNK